MMVIFNPVAGGRRVRHLWRVLDILSAAGMRFELAETQCAGDAVHIARDAAGLGYRLCVAAGGDGTVADVTNGLLGSDVPLGIIPLGTANVLAHELGLVFSPQGIAAALAFKRTRPLWPGTVAGTGGNRLFVQMVSAGFDAQVVHRLWLPLKRLVGRAAYVAQTLRELPRYPFAPVRVRLDGIETSAANVIVSKGRLYGGNYLLAPCARPDQQGFSVALFDRCGPLPALLYGAALPLNLLPRAPGLRLVRAGAVEILDAVPVQADGDPAGVSPLRISDVAAPIQVVVG